MSVEAEEAPRKSILGSKSAFPLHSGVTEIEILLEAILLNYVLSILSCAY